MSKGGSQKYVKKSRDILIKNKKSLTNCKVRELIEM